MKILVVKEEAGLKRIHFTLSYNTMSKNILKLLYPIYKNHLIYIIKEIGGYSSYEVYEEVVVLTYEEFLSSEV